MNLDKAKFTIACTNCSQDITTTLAELRLWPVLTCAACGHQIADDFGPIITIAERMQPKDEASNLRDIELLSDADLIRVPDAQQTEGH